MKTIVLAGVLALAACNSRTELLFGVATDLNAPDALDTVQLDVLRVDNGFLEQQVIWDISGQLNLPFNLPGSYGVFSDGEEVQLDVRLTGLKNNEQIVSRRSVVTLVEGETLFYRIGLSAGCIDRSDCPDTHSCVEGVCRDVNVNSDQLPDFSVQLVDELTCTPGVTYINTGTGEPMPLSADAAECPAGLCLEGTCLKPVPEESGNRTVRGTQIVSFVRPNNMITNVPLDLSQLDVAALVADGNGVFETIPGVGNADGTFAIQDVPHGTYTLKVGTTFTVTTADNVDLGFVDLGRPDKTPVVNTATTGFNLNVTGMNAWADGNILSAYAPEANAWWFFFDDAIQTPPAIGQTALTNVAVNYDASGGSSTDLIANDAFALLQYTNKSAGDVDGTTYQVVTKMLAPPPFTMVEGQLTQITGAFTDVAQTETISFDVRQLEWESSVGWNGTNPMLLNPTAVPVDFSTAGVTGDLGGVNLDVFGQPGGNTYGHFSATLDYLFLSAPEGKNSTFTNLTFGKPHVSGHTFGQMLFAGISYAVPYQLPGTGGPTNQFITVNTVRPANTDLLVVSPLLGPVRDATINERDIFIGQQGVPASSRISWKAPAVGSASMYIVTFNKLGIDASNNTIRTQVAAVRTTDTFLDIPPGILEIGQSYYFVIQSTTIGNIDSAGRRRLPEAFTPVASAIMTIGSGGDVDPTPPDAGTGGEVDAPPGVCNLISQAGCQAGNKCTAEAGEIKCAANGAVSIGGACAGDGPLDDCTAGGLCIFQQCRAFCPQDGSPAGCAANETCHVFDVFNACLTNCNVLAPSCPATAQGPQNCYETSFGGECINSSGNVAVGSSCTFINECTAGSGCIGNLCLKYCDFAQFPDVQGPCNAGQTCQLFNPNDNVGVCTVPL